MIEDANRPRRRWPSWLAQVCLVLITLAIMAAILLPVFRGVSSDERSRAALSPPPASRPGLPARQP